MNNIAIDNQQFFNLVNEGYIIVDVRSVGEDQMTGLSYTNAINIPYPQIINQAEKYFPEINSKIIFICNYGSRSGLSAKTYKNKGYKNVFVLKSGLYGLK